MVETRIEPQGEQDLTDAIMNALTDWFAEAEITAAVRWPGQGAWERLVDRYVTPVSERLYRAGAAVVTGEALETFLDGVRDRLTRQSTLIEDIKAAQDKHGDDAASIDWTGVDGDSTPWRSRTELMGRHEAQVTSMQSATDSAETGSRKRWRSRGDDRVRSAHRAADGQAVPLNEPFNVGGAQLMYPGDPSGPADQVLNCRCEMFLITPESEGTVESSLLTAAVTIDMDAPLAPRDRRWDGSEAVQALRAWATEDDELDENKMARGFLWRTDGPPSDWKLPVATVIDGTLTLVWSGITAAAAAVQGARTPIDLPESDIETVKSALARLYAKAAREFDDDSITSPWQREAALTAKVREVAELDLNAATHMVEEAQHELTAAAVRKRGGAWRPDAHWFQPPSEQAKARMAAGEQPLVQDNGRVLGYVATWQQPDGSPTVHLGYLDAGKYQPVPGQQDYSYFHQRNINYPLSDGTAGHVGIITDQGHPTDVDNPQQQAAIVRVGEDDTGVWIAGAVFRDIVQDDQPRFSRMKASAISGEWDLTTGQFRGAAMVNHPGFPQPTTRGQDWYALAASLTADSPAELAALRDTTQQLITYGPKLLEILAAIAPLQAQEDEPEDSQRDENEGALTEASVRFLQLMNAHHKAGVTMGRQYLEQNESQRNPAVTDIAQEILQEQSSQVEQMEALLSRTGNPIDPPKDAMQEMMRDMGGDGMTMSSGLDTDEQTPLEDTDEQDTGTEPAAEGEEQEAPNPLRSSDPEPEPDAVSTDTGDAEEDPGIEPELLDAARKILADKDTLTAAVSSIPDGVDLPPALKILESFLSDDEDVPTQHARAASIKAAEAICKSPSVQRAEVRARACQLVSQYRNTMKTGA